MIIVLINMFQQSSKVKSNFNKGMDLTLNTECQTLKLRKVASFATSIEENSNVCN